MGKKSTIDRQSQMATPEYFPFRPPVPSWYNTFRWVAALGLVIVPLLFALALILSITDPSGRSQSPALALTAMFFTWVFLLYLSESIVTLSDIALEDEGIRLQLLGSRSLLVPWQALREMTIKEVGAFPIYDRRRLLQRQQARVFIAIHVPGLTFLHLFTGLYYGLGFYPVFVVTPDHERYEILIERLKQAAIEQGCDPERLE
jgi:hypothetical protein